MKVYNFQLDLLFCANFFFVRYVIREIESKILAQCCKIGYICTLFKFVSNWLQQNGRFHLSYGIHRYIVTAIQLNVSAYRTKWPRFFSHNLFFFARKFGKYVVLYSCVYVCMISFNKKFVSEIEINVANKMYSVQYINSVYQIQTIILLSTMFIIHRNENQSTLIQVINNKNSSQNTSSNICVSVCVFQIRKFAKFVTLKFRRHSLWKYIYKKKIKFQYKCHNEMRAFIFSNHILSTKAIVCAIFV